ncbi:MAG: hypothetical protein BWY66_01788 [bacterium ADurb.Bin374]|nr:MAG: hypothetical protein BWY66_01788 [bacterium ADurb.Bin374]
MLVAVSARFAGGLGRANAAGRFGQEGLAGEVHAALRVDLDHFHGDFVADVHDVFDLVHAVVVELADVNHAFDAGQDLDERAELHDALHLAGVGLAHFGVFGDLADHVEGLLDRGLIGADDRDVAVVTGVDLDLALFLDLADGLSAGSDQVADLVRIDVDRLDAGGVDRQRGAGLRDRLHHLLENVHAAQLRLRERGLHDLEGDAVDLDVHLQGGDARGGAGDLEVHIAEVILVAEDVGQDFEVVAFLDQAHGDARHRGLDRNAGIHHREGARADRRHRGASIAGEDLADDAHSVGEHVLRRHDAGESALGEGAVTDLAAAGAAHGLAFAGRERREVVVQQELLLVLLVDSVDDLRVGCRAQRDDAERLGLAACEQRRAVRAGQEAHGAGDRADVGQAAAVDAAAFLEDHPAQFALDDVFLDGVGALALLAGFLAVFLLKRGFELVADDLELVLPGGLLGGVQRVAHVCEDRVAYELFELGVGGRRHDDHLGLADT